MRRASKYIRKITISKEIEGNKDWRIKKSKVYF